MLTFKGLHGLHSFLNVGVWQLIDTVSLFFGTQAHPAEVVWVYRCRNHKLVFAVSKKWLWPGI